MKFPRLKSKDYTLIAIVAVAVLFFVQAIRNQRENFTDNGWKADDGTLLSVSITEDGTLWGITPDNAVWRKTKGAAWSLTKGRTSPGTNISGKTATKATVVGTDGRVYFTIDGGETWASLGSAAKWVSEGNDGTIGIVLPGGELVAVNADQSRILTAGNGLMIAVGDAQNIYTITGDSQVWKWAGGTWQNQGFMSRFIAAAKGGLLVSIGTDGRCQQREGSGPLTAFSGDNVRNISASSTMLACTTNDNKTWTMDIATVKAAAPAAAAPAAAAPAAPSTNLAQLKVSGPAAASAPGLTAGTYSASCPQCSVVNGQISCACDVLPKA